MLSIYYYGEKRKHYFRAKTHEEITETYLFSYREENGSRGKIF